MIVTETKLRDLVGYTPTSSAILKYVNQRVTMLKG